MLGRMAMLFGLLFGRFPSITPDDPLLFHRRSHAQPCLCNTGWSGAHSHWPSLTRQFGALSLWHTGASNGSAVVLLCTVGVSGFHFTVFTLVLHRSIRCTPTLGWSLRISIRCSHRSIRCIQSGALIVFGVCSAVSPVLGFCLCLLFCFFSGVPLCS